MNKKLITLYDPNSNIAEIYRSIRTNIEYSSIDNPLKVINVTSTFANEAKSTTTCNLGIISAIKSKTILLVDLDLRNPSVHKMFQIKNSLGLTDLLIDFVENGENVNIDKYLQQIDEPSVKEKLFILTSGTEVVNPTEILSSKKIKELFEFLKQRFDQILIDSSPSGVISDGIITSTIADGTIYIVESGKTKIDIAEQTINQLRNLKVNLLGVVLTKVPSKTMGYGYYGYGQVSDSENKRKIRINLD
ncbi:MAG: capsular exopolysaccharide family protein [Haloplasmataceae bacterium]|jgi:capsular exopolysaccharide synthesis family protein|nr:capsular exopolysaccharide family protein [Haloplasmataceae bacterium]